MINRIRGRRAVERTALDIGLLILDLDEVLEVALVAGREALDVVGGDVEGVVVIHFEVWRGA